MALRAGYYGLKGSVKKTLEALATSASGMKIIKTIGDGLNLTSAGKLNVTAATDSKLGGIKVGEGLSIDNGLLSCDITGIKFSTDEFDTGMKWIDDKPIYGKVLTGDSLPATGTTLISNIDFCIVGFGAVLYHEGQSDERWFQFTFPAASKYQRWELYTTTHELKYLAATPDGSKYKFAFLYTKIEEE